MSELDKELPQPVVAVAGGGLVGLSIAWRLAQQGFRILIFEKNFLGQEASWAGAGMLAPGGEVEAPSAFASLAIESRNLYPEFIRELEATTQMSIDYQECGALDLAYDSEQWEVLERRAQQQAPLGIRSKQLTQQQVSAFWPRVRSDNLKGALFYSADALVNPRELMLALASACRGLGVQIFENSPIGQAEITTDHVTIKTGGEAISADALVIASGAWSSSIELMRVPNLPDAFPVKGHLVGFHQPDQTCNTIIRFGHTYLLQRANGLLISGASVEHVGWDRHIDPSIAASLARDAGFILPHLNETTPSEIWVGFRPGSDSLQLGSWHSERLYLAYGHYRNGILLAPVTAQIISRAISANLRRH